MTSTVLFFILYANYFAIKAIEDTMYARTSVELPEILRNVVQIDADTLDIRVGLYSDNTSVTDIDLHASSAKTLRFVAESPPFDFCFPNSTRQRIATISYGLKPQRCNLEIKWTKDQFFINTEPPLSAHEVSVEIKNGKYVYYNLNESSNSARNFRHCMPNFNSVPNSMFDTHFSLSSEGIYNDDSSKCAMFFKFDGSYYKIAKIIENSTSSVTGIDDDIWLSVELIIILSVFIAAAILIVILVTMTCKTKTQLKDETTKKSEGSIIVTANSQASKRDKPTTNKDKVATKRKAVSPQRNRNTHSGSMHAVQATFGAGGGGFSQTPPSSHRYSPVSMGTSYSQKSTSHRQKSASRLKQYEKDKR